MSEAHFLGWFPTTCRRTRGDAPLFHCGGKVRGHYILYEEAFNWKRQEKYMELTVP